MDSQISITSSSSLAISTRNTDSNNLSDRVVEVIQQWVAYDAKVSSSQIHKLTLLLDTKYLLQLPRLKGMRRLLSPPSPAEIRHSYYCQAAKILGWKERSLFGDEVHHVVKFVLWPDVLESSSHPSLKRNQHASRCAKVVAASTCPPPQPHYPHTQPLILV